MGWNRFAWGLFVSTGLLLLALASAFVPVSVPASQAGYGSIEALEAGYSDWADSFEAAGARYLMLPLGRTPGLTTPGPVEMQGTARVDFATGAVNIVVEAPEAAGLLDAWLVSSPPGSSVAFDSDDRFLRLGTLRGTDGILSLQAQDVWRDALAYDAVAITPARRTPSDTSLLTGMVTLFPRVYWASRTNRRDALIPTSVAGVGSRIASLLMPPVSAQIGPIPNPSTQLQLLLTQGRRAFFNETFGGNGRTCGTCHREDNNLTIDAEYIATLPPDDPLFAAETRPALAKNFDNPLLMRRLGLFLVNADGLDDLANKFVMRGAKSLNAMMPNTLRPGTLDETSAGSPPFERVGWSGDLAPGGGTLREEAIGAIVQYLPRTLGRVAGVDFRLPTVAELDELEAFQKSLGRRSDMDITSANRLRFRSARVERGLAIFNDPGQLPPFFDGSASGAGRCILCHFNAGAGDFFEFVLRGGPADPTLVSSAQLNNSNFDTGVEDIPNQPADALVPPAQNPPDGGFGRDPIFKHGVFAGFGNGAASEVNQRTFNTPVLVEAADTGPFFHNNSVSTIEGAVEFYSTPAFNNSPIGSRLPGAISLSVQESADVAALLRVLNTLENIRSARDLVRRALLTTQNQQAMRVELVQLSISELEDAIEVLAGRSLHPEVQRLLVRAGRLARMALRARAVQQGNARLRRMDRLLVNSWASIVE